MTAGAFGLFVSVCRTYELHFDDIRIFSLHTLALRMVHVRPTHSSQLVQACMHVGTCVPQRPKLHPRRRMLLFAVCFRESKFEFRHLTVVIRVPRSSQAAEGMYARWCSTHTTETCRLSEIQTGISVMQMLRRGSMSATRRATFENLQFGS